MRRVPKAADNQRVLLTLLLDVGNSRAIHLRAIANPRGLGSVVYVNGRTCRESHRAMKRC
jgi:hypothetical protein